METFSAVLAICAGNSPVPGEFPAQRPVTRGFDVFVDLRLNKRLSKQSWGWWFETLSRPLWRHCNGRCNLFKWVSNEESACMSWRLHGVLVVRCPNSHWAIVSWNLKNWLKNFKRHILIWILLKNSLTERSLVARHALIYEIETTCWAKNTNKFHGKK